MPSTLPSTWRAASVGLKGAGRLHEFLLNGQASGVYLVKVSQDNEIGIGKVVLKDD